MSFRSLVIFAGLCLVKVTSTPVLGQADPQLIDNRYQATIVAPEEVAQLANVGELTVDSLGFLWFSSTGGLHRYDGKDLWTYNNNRVSGTIDLTKSGTGYARILSTDGWFLWVLELETYYWVCIDVRTREVVRHEEIKGSMAMRHASAEPGREVYLLDGNSDPGQGATVTCLSCDSLQSDHIPDLGNIEAYKCFDGAHWISSDSGLWKIPYDLSSREFIPLDTHHFFMPGNQDSLQFYSTDFSECLTFDPGLNQIRATTGSPEYFENHWYRVLKFGNKVWFIDEQREIFLWDCAENTLENYSELLTNLISTESPLSIATTTKSGIEMADGTIFLRGFNLVLQLRPKPPSEEQFLEPINSGKPITSMRQIAEDAGGNIYASYYTGVAVKIRGTDSFIDFRGTRDAPKNSEATYSLSHWKNHVIWNNAIIDLQSDDVVFINKSIYGYSWTHALVGDTLWYHAFGTQMLGKYNLNEHDNTELRIDFPKGYQLITTMLHDTADHTFWLSTVYDGILQLNNEGVTLREISMDDLGVPWPQYYIYDLVKHDNIMWFGSRLGLGRIDLESGEIEHFNHQYPTDRGGLQDRWVFFMHEQEDSNFLLGTNHGIVHFNTATHAFTELVEGHPLGDKEFNRNAHFRASDGRYYFGTVDGLYSFGETDLEFGLDNNSVSRPQIHEIAIFNASDGGGRMVGQNLTKISMKSNDHMLKLQFSSPSFGKKVYYSYRVQGLIAQWSDYQLSGELEILSIPSGEHIIEIRATTDPGSDNFSITEIPIDKLQVWYRRPWVIGIFVFFIILIVSSVVSWWSRVRLKRLKALEALRTKISSDLHDDVGSILSGLAMQSEMLTYHTKSDQDKTSLRQISAMSRDAMERMRDTVWAIDARKDKYGDLIARMRGFAEDIFEKKGIDHTFHVSAMDSQEFINPEVRQNIYLIFKESIANIIRHSDANKVDIVLLKEGRKLEMSIQDNGSKLPDSQMEGLGISNMHLRAARISGIVKTEYLDGFRVHLKLEV